jgi:hypothetical protein
LADALRVVTQDGEPVQDATIRVFSAIQYASGDYSEWEGATTTDEYGAWRDPIEVTAGSWVVYVYKSFDYGPTSIEVEVAEPPPPEEP